MKSSIIKVVKQTQFETCVTTFIALDFKLGRKSIRMGSEIFSVFEGYFLMTVPVVQLFSTNVYQNLGVIVQHIHESNDSSFCPQGQATQ